MEKNKFEYAIEKAEEISGEKLSDSLKNVTINILNLVEKETAKKIFKDIEFFADYLNDSFSDRIAIRKDNWNALKLKFQVNTSEVQNANGSCFIGSYKDGIYKNKKNKRDKKR